MISTLCVWVFQCPSIPYKICLSAGPSLPFAYFAVKHNHGLQYSEQDFYQLPQLQCRKYYTEYLFGTKRQRFPLLYYLDYHGRIPKFFTFVDPVGNQFEVAVLEGKTRIYLDHGSEIIGHFYGLNEGALLTLFTLTASTFLMRIKDRNGNEIVYPTPPSKFTLGDKNVPIHISDNEGPGDQACYQHMEANFYHTLFKTLSHSDVSSGFLTMPVGFCQLAFAPSTRAVKLIDQSGETWNCIIEWNPAAFSDCKLAGDWPKLCKKWRFKEGVAVKLGVAKDICGLLYFMLV